MNPRVACIMPTAGRTEFAKRAVEYFLAQTYPNKSLIIYDDEADRSFPNGIGDLWQHEVYYSTLISRLYSLGEKRNISCRDAQAEIILHWDDDDYSAPGRIADQVARLQDYGKAVTGYSQMLFTDGPGWWSYQRRDPYAIGTSLCYRKSWWQNNPFAAVNVGEDRKFMEAARRTGELVSAPAKHFMVASVHPGNTSTRPLDGGSYIKVKRPEGIGSPFDLVAA